MLFYWDFIDFWKVRFCDVIKKNIEKSIFWRIFKSWQWREWELFLIDLYLWTGIGHWQLSIYIPYARFYKILGQFDFLFEWYAFYELWKWNWEIWNWKYHYWKLRKSDIFEKITFWTFESGQTMKLQRGIEFLCGQMVISEGAFKFLWTFWVKRKSDIFLCRCLREGVVR